MQFPELIKIKYEGEKPMPKHSQKLAHFLVVRDSIYKLGKKT
jgi:hypothetical protein